MVSQTLQLRSKEPGEKNGDSVKFLLDVFDNVTLWKTNIAMEYPHL